MKKFIMSAAVFGMSLFMVLPVQAAPRKEKLQSKGSINFEQGKVFISSKDLYYLADQIDSLEETYKKNTINALNTIGTYFKKDGSIIHVVEGNEVIEDADKTGINLSQIIQGIKESQSISSIEGIQAVSKEQIPFFYQSQEAAELRNHLEISETDTGIPLLYKAAVEDNLSAGCAAWVNGILVKGNGQDNKHFREIGYREGFADGMAEVLEKARIEYHYHEHEGNSSTEGGCYGKKTGTRTNTCGCNSYAWADYDGNGTSTCANCWHNHGGSACNAVTSRETYTYIGLVCNKTTETIESATIYYE